MFRSWIRPLTFVAFCCLAITAFAATPDLRPDVPTPDVQTADVDRPIEAAEHPTLDGVETRFDLAAVLGTESGRWLRQASGGGGSCYNCDAHSECDNFCGPFGGACLRDLDETCDPGCPAPPCDQLKYCWCF
ncbi:MAG: hypothetical protein AAGE94_04170 [Acidobacteriota bacterium]